MESSWHVGADSLRAGSWELIAESSIFGSLGVGSSRVGSSGVDRSGVHSSA